MNHFYTEKLSFFRSSRFVFAFREASGGENVDAQKLKNNPEGKPIKGNENPDALALGKAREGKDAIGKGGNELLALQGPEGLKNAIDAAKKNPVDAFYKLREDSPYYNECLPVISKELAERHPNIFLINADKLKPSDVETAVTNPKASPDCLLAFTKDDAVIAKAVNNLMKTDPKTILRLKGNPKYADVVAKAEEKNSRMSPQYT